MKTHNTQQKKLLQVLICRSTESSSYKNNCDQSNLPVLNTQDTAVINRVMNNDVNNDINLPKQLEIRAEFQVLKNFLMESNCIICDKKLRMLI